jgi:hypothetical protein
MAAKEKPVHTTSLMGDFEEVSALWEGGAAPYPSEQSARWALRQMKRELAEAGALALHRGRIMVHIQRASEVAQRHAIATMQRRCGVPSET